ncbi:MULTISPECIES: tRNA uracil 4-sulfurtransferase ThiI [unclassified Gemella]|uniref:tRNA uracil 4-sulfurtransferase ThiI n=1 Tax=unclassified Gemella TaxID=2624949 RepID=UPI0010740A06|nr:tRNA 4-thiouridine(8) synthase ThiI [Gemella sp. GL1.1]MBF0747118.1 tRNA 4-thiouridine(8) synthase ThiI [Gemella sp. 19428wG2_WT2a]NYS27138.1 tRNA 4-thiouridine(8) synthase ThiI [Gemella sp. GL1]TFU58361.1 tRNA 4-thiouridine(8) synthase ThiI [Gemella sp. WT2a]
MQYSHIIVRYGELTLKSGNRNEFLKKLTKNIKLNFKEFKGYHIQTKRDRMYIHLDKNDYIDEILTSLKRIPGIHTFSPVLRAGLDIEDAKKNIDLLLHTKLDGNYKFKIQTKRPNKNFPNNTNELNNIFGSHVLVNYPNLKVDVKNPDFVINVEVRSEGIFIFTDFIKGVGGFPVNTSSKALLLLSGGIDSPVAAHMLQVKGVEVEMLHFQSPPFTSKEALDKIFSLAQELSKVIGTVKVHVVNFTKLQTEIVKRIPSNYTMTSTRRFMLKIADKIARKEDCLALATGESLGQVASQTLESMNCINEVTNMPVLRPLLTMDKVDIIKIAEEIGTYEISNLPFEDCCTIFTPKAPKTRPKLKKIIGYEARDDYSELIEECIASAQTYLVNTKAVNLFEENREKNLQDNEDFSGLL